MASTWTVDDIPANRSEKTILITGATSGIRLEAARAFASRQCTLILACRNREKMGAVASSFREAGAGQIFELVCDMGGFESVRWCATSVLALPSAIDALLLNVAKGGMVTSKP